MYPQQTKSAIDVIFNVVFKVLMQVNCMNNFVSVFSLLDECCHCCSWCRENMADVQVQKKIVALHDCKVW